MYPKYFLTLVLGSSLTFALRYVNEVKCDHAVIARLPPSEGKPNPKFKFTGPGYFSGQYFQTYSSLDLGSLGVRNLQLITTFEVERDTTGDLTSYQVGDCPHIYTIFATDKNANKSELDNYFLEEPGTKIRHYNDIIAYGRDSRCHIYFVVFGRQNTDSEPSLNIASQVQEGPSPPTIDAIKKALIKLGSKKLTELAKALKRNPNDDGKRLGLADFICDYKCKMNRNSPPEDGSCPS